LVKTIHLEFPFQDFIDTSNWFYYFNENWEIIKFNNLSINFSFQSSSLFIASDVSDVSHIPEGVDCFYDDEMENFFIEKIKPLSYIKQKSSVNSEKEENFNLDFKDVDDDSKKMFSSSDESEIDEFLELYQENDYIDIDYFVPKRIFQKPSSITRVSKDTFKNFENYFDYDGIELKTISYNTMNKQVIKPSIINGNYSIRNNYNSIGKMGIFDIQLIFEQTNDDIWSDEFDKEWILILNELNLAHISWNIVQNKQEFQMDSNIFFECLQKIKYCKFEVKFIKFGMKCSKEVFLNELDSKFDFKLINDYFTFSYDLCNVINSKEIIIFLKKFNKKSCFYNFGSHFTFNYFEKLKNPIVFFEFDVFKLNLYNRIKNQFHGNGTRMAMIINDRKFLFDSLKDNYRFTSFLREFIRHFKFWTKSFVNTNSFRMEFGISLRNEFDSIEKLSEILDSTQNVIRRYIEIQFSDKFIKICDYKHTIKTLKEIEIEINNDHLNPFLNSLRQKTICFLLTGNSLKYKLYLKFNIL
jgi:hypothetical protein